MDDQFCAAPFYQITLKPNGQATPCCYHYGFQLGSIAERGIADVWNGSKMRALREEFISGKVKSCRGRQQALNCHNRFAEHAHKIQRTTMLPYPPKRLDLRLNGTCNLSCVMCEVWQEPAGRYASGTFWDEVASTVAPALDSCDILGGEPFIQADTFRMIDQIIAVNPRCTFAFVTNGHYPYSKKLDTYLRKIRIRYLQLSIDSLDADTYHSIRHGSLDLVLHSVEAFLHLQQTHEHRFHLVFSMCVLRNNWRELPAFLAFCKERGAGADLQFAHYDPSRTVSLRYAPPDELQKIREFLGQQDAAYAAPLSLIDRSIADLLSKR